MLRIIAGNLGGRQFDSPPGHRAHPMSDRIKNALFNTLGDLSGLSVLDAFGGSGALAFESISRGADHALICEVEPKIAASIESIIESLDIASQTKLSKRSVYNWVQHHDEQFDIVIADPPYGDFAEQRLENLLPALKPGGLMVISYPSNIEAPRLSEVEIILQKSYGNAALAFYRKSKK